MAVSGSLNRWYRWYIYIYIILDNPPIGSIYHWCFILMFTPEQKRMPWTPFFFTDLSENNRRNNKVVTRYYSKNYANLEMMMKWWSMMDHITLRIHVWYICLHLVDFFGVHVGKYTIHGCYGTEQQVIGSLGNDGVWWIISYLQIISFWILQKGKGSHANFQVRSAVEGTYEAIICRGPISPFITFVGAHLTSIHWTHVAIVTRPGLGGGFKYFLCSSLPGEMIQFD